ncbi:MAG: ABC transporter substrate-binding protein [Bacteroidales bacterium]|nr:ABC transporter substrate-binding protein [Bacteroidales bacterium]
MRYFCRLIWYFAALGTLLCSCGGSHHGDRLVEAGEPEFFSIVERPQGGWTVVSVSHFDGSSDTLVVDKPMTNIIVMSTSHYGFLDALGRTDVISGISGPDYLWTGDFPCELRASEASSGGSTASLREAPPLASLRSAPVPPLTVPRVAWVSPSRLASAASSISNGEEVHRRQPTSVLADVGYDGAPDYETIVSLRPEVVLTYAVSGVESPFVGRLKQLGIKVLTVNEHLERHPLARAAYIRLFGALTGDMATADSVLSVVRTNYTAIAEGIKERGVTPRKVLLNIPYNDQWFVPASDNYLTVMIHDAGGTVLGCEEGKAASTVMSVEKAYSLSKEADCWLNVGWCSTEKDLLGVNPIFSDMLKAIKDNATGMVPDGFPVVWNDNKRVNAKGGNDIWQSGVVRPDLVLRDLAVILHPIEDNNNVIYYKPII